MNYYKLRDLRDLIITTKQVFKGIYNFKEGK